jgi:hypothetical protein
MAKKGFFAASEQTEEIVFAALEREIKAAATKARVKALSEMVPGLRESDDELWPLLRQLEEQGGRS